MPQHTPPLSHAGQRVLITAAASGIGLVTAQAFVAAGARVYICDIDAAALADTLLRHPSLAGQVCDVADEAQVAALFQAAVKHLGGLDILVNNAGVAGPTALLEEMQFADWRRCLAVNLDSCFLCARAAAPILRRQGSGSIINMSSTAGQYGFARRAPYAAAKWAIRGLTRTLAQELGPAKVRVNCVSPGHLVAAHADLARGHCQHHPVRDLGRRRPHFGPGPDRGRPHRDPVARARLACSDKGQRHQRAGHGLAKAGRHQLVVVGGEGRHALGQGGLAQALGRPPLLRRRTAGILGNL